MNEIRKALLWAGAMLGLSAMVAMGWIARESAEPLLYAMPVLAVLTMKNTNSCCTALRGRS